MVWNYLSIPKLQRSHRWSWSLEISNFIPPHLMNVTTYIYIYNSEPNDIYFTSVATSCEERLPACDYTSVVTCVPFLCLTVWGSIRIEETVITIRRTLRHPITASSMWILAINITNTTDIACSQIWTINWICAVCSQQTYQGKSQ